MWVKFELKNNQYKYTAQNNFSKIYLHDNRVTNFGKIENLKKVGNVRALNSGPPAFWILIELTLPLPRMLEVASSNPASCLIFSNFRFF